LEHVIVQSCALEHLEAAQLGQGSDWKQAVVTLQDANPA
jgi:hypothetical protein